MKISGMIQAMKQIETIGCNINEKIDNIRWEGNNQGNDNRKNEFYNAGIDIVEEIKEKLKEITDLRIENF